MNVQPNLAYCEVPFSNLVRGTFIRRDNRFRVQVQVSGTSAAAHLANPGRLQELLIPGREVWLTPAAAPHRRTHYDLTLVAYAGGYVSLNAHLPNALAAQALQRRAIPELAGYTQVYREVHLGESRLDFRLEGQVPPCWIEVKSVTLVINGIARFPDAPTLRGQRHLRELIDAVILGERAAVIFVVQREDASAFAPNDATDPQFGDLLRRAQRAGVAVHALGCRVSPASIRLISAIPMCL